MRRHGNARRLRTRMDAGPANALPGLRSLCANGAERTQRLGREAHEQFEIAHIGIVHRTGRLEIGETSVVIAVSAPHRQAAFAACEWAIRELKRTVPIWKKRSLRGRRGLGRRRKKTNETIRRLHRLRRTLNHSPRALLLSLGSSIKQPLNFSASNPCNLRNRRITS